MLACLPHAAHTRRPQRLSTIQTASKAPCSTWASNPSSRAVVAARMCTFTTPRPTRAIGQLNEDARSQGSAARRAASDKTLRLEVGIPAQRHLLYGRLSPVYRVAGWGCRFRSRAEIAVVEMALSYNMHPAALVRASCIRTPMHARLMSIILAVR